MKGIKLLIVLGIAVCAAATVLAVSLTGGKSSGLSQQQAGVKIAAAYNAAGQKAQIVHVFKCLKGKVAGTYECAVVVTPDGTSAVCATIIALVAPAGVQLGNIAQADPNICYFAA